MSNEIFPILSLIIQSKYSNKKFKRSSVTGFGELILWSVYIKKKYFSFGTVHINRSCALSLSLSLSLSLPLSPSLPRQNTTFPFDFLQELHHAARPTLTSLYFISPRRFNGNQRFSYGQKLNFRFRITSGRPQASREDVVIKGDKYVDKFVFRGSAENE